MAESWTVLLAAALEAAVLVLFGWAVLSKGRFSKPERW
jgi:hypothetical protein